MKKVVLLLVIPLMLSCVDPYSILNKLTLQELKDLHKMGDANREEIKDYMILKGWALKSDNEDTLSLVYGQFPEDTVSAILEYIVARDMEKYTGTGSAYKDFPYIRYATYDSNHYQSIINELHKPGSEWELTTIYGVDYIDPSVSWHLYSDIRKVENKTMYDIYLFDFRELDIIGRRY